MEITVLFFATLKEKAGASKTVVELTEGACVADLKAAVLAKFPAMQAQLGSVLVAVNRQFATDEDMLTTNSEVALFPPVSGGAWPTICKIVEGPLDLDELVAAITLNSTGAACLFTGMVRGVTQRGAAHETAALEYEAYIPMAEAKMQQVAEEIRDRWAAVEGIIIVQRIGTLQAGTPTVLIACSAAHRDTGVFEAARYGIDRLKEIVPVWKKEIGPDGEEWIEGKYHPGQGD